MTVPSGEGTAIVEPTGGRFCSLPCLLQLCNGRTSPSLGTGHQHTHLCSYKAGKINPLPPAMPCVASKRRGTFSRCQDVRQCHPPGFSGWDGMKFAPCTSVCVSSTVPYFLLRDRLNINTVIHVFGRGEGERQALPHHIPGTMSERAPAPGPGS